MTRFRQTPEVLAARMIEPSPERAERVGRQLGFMAQMPQTRGVRRAEARRDLFWVNCGLIAGIAVGLALTAFEHRQVIFSFWENVL